MGKLIVMGGNRLVGEIGVSGSKNAVLPIMAASLLTKGTCTLFNVPLLKDVLVMQKVLEHLGAKVTFENKVMIIDSRHVESKEVGENLMRQLRASNLVMGSLLSRFKKIKVSYPGGCAIGSRPMDLHIKGFMAMGAKVTEKYGFIEAETEHLRGADIQLDFPSVGATENLIMAASLAEGTTIIRNAAREPEIVDLQNFLSNLGVRINGAGLDIIKIEGVKELGSIEHTIIPDRIEAGTHLIAAAITGGDVLVKEIIPEHLESVIAKLKEVGLKITKYDEAVRITAVKRPQAVDFKTMPYPGFPTDLQPQLMALMTIANGTCIASESIFDNRFKHIDEFRRMGADIKLEGKAAIIKGVPSLTGAFVEATDLRAGAALILAGMIAEDATVIENAEHIDRGYENIENKYNALGAKLFRVNNSKNGS
ncbi:UDP-N-acetylglucosamine 1-carboxyvinyltransferase [Bacillota bacterium LX-D]|nr:UDP-N-acetylglucosamine 1-carboxyvinyltransferase [Bacillota bacterium LX-D]